MLSYTAKRAYYFFMGPLMKLNGMFYKNFRQSKDIIKVQLGPGSTNALKGWVNVDANPFAKNIQVWSDFSESIPFKNNSVECFYSHHVIEHLREDFLQNHFNEMFRSLKSGGAIRIGGPNADASMKKYLEGDMDWFPDFPVKRESIGGKFANFMMCLNEHYTLLTPSYLEEICKKAGFVDFCICLPKKETKYLNEEVMINEYEYDYEMPRTLIIEARKP